ncbi:MAG: CRISPR-associated endonuclease Cas1 [Phycisphaerae bacterium]
METPHPESEYIPIRMLNEYLYCPRLFYLMHSKGLFDDSADTISGSAQHNRKRNRQTKPEEKPWPDSITKSFILSDEEHGITGKFDGIYETQDEVIPVEDKKSSSPKGDKPFIVEGYELQGDIWNNDQMQLAAQCLLLQTNGFPCTKGYIYYRGNNKKLPLQFGEQLKKALIAVIEKAHKTANSDTLPEPLTGSEKCIRCSLNELCMPDETQFIKRKIDEPRKIIVGRDDAGIVYAVTSGTYISKKSDALTIDIPNEPQRTIPLKDVSHVCLGSNCQITTQAMIALVKKDATVNFVTPGGWLEAVITSPLSKNIHLRRKQFAKFKDEQFIVRLARNIVSSKISNQRTLLRRNMQRDDDCLERLNELISRLNNASSIDTIRGLEGAAANIYWNNFPKALSDEKNFDMSSRNKRPPRDPINALLSYGYTLLVRDFYSAIVAVGLDPMFGFYHKPVAGRPALALDMMEAFRPLIVDSTVLRVINSNIIKRDDFLQLSGCCQMKLGTKKKWLAAYENRVDELVTHPMFEYRMSYRRILQLEVRLLARVIEGEFEDYIPLMTR